MNLWTSECSSSGCESGWTKYLDQLPNYEKKGANVMEDEEDEDLSMVSDASSGPPHLHENFAVHDPHEYYGYASSVQEDKNKSKQKSNTKETRVKKQHLHHNLCLDDTASSPMFQYFSQDDAVPPENHNSVGHFSQAYSVAHFEEDPIQKKHLGIFKSSTKGKSGSWLGRKRQ